MNFSFQPEAEAEFNDAVAFYEDFETGLGEAFSDAVLAAIGRIARFPRELAELFSPIAAMPL